MDWSRRIDEGAPVIDIRYMELRQGVVRARENGQAVVWSGLDGDCARAMTTEGVVIINRGLDH